MATSEQEIPRLEELERRGRANGLQGIRRLTPQQLREIEPHAAGIAGLHVAETGVVDFAAVAHAYADVVRTAGGGGPAQRRRPPRAGRRRRARAGNGPGRGQVPPAGQLRRPARRSRGGAVRVPAQLPHRAVSRGVLADLTEPRPPGQGPYLSRSRSAAAVPGRSPHAPHRRLGRDGPQRRAHAQPPRLPAGPASVSPTPVDVLGYRGFWRMAGRFWRTGVSEFRRSLSRRAFARQAQRLVPELKASRPRAGRIGRAGPGGRSRRPSRRRLSDRHGRPRGPRPQRAVPGGHGLDQHRPPHRGHGPGRRAGGLRRAAPRRRPRDIVGAVHSTPWV